MSFFNQILTFLAVVEAQSFTKAGERLNISTTAVSKQIKLLEHHFGANLIERSTRTMRLTEIGERFYLHCERIARELHAAEDFVAMQQHEPQGLLRVFVSFVAADLFVIKHLQEFRDKYPLIDLKIELGDYFPDSQRENYDAIVGFSMLPQVPNHLKFKRLIRNEYILCGSPYYLAKHQIPKSPSDLKSHQWLNHPLRQPMNVINFKDGTEVRIHEPKLIINSIQALLKVCEQGGGLMLVSKIQAQPYLDSGVLQRVLPTYDLSEIDVYVFFNPSEYEQKKLQCFIDFYAEKTASFR